MPRRPNTTTDEPVSQVSFKSPPARPTKYDWTKIATQLKRKPGQWALVFEHDRASVANAIRMGSIVAVRPEDGFEVRTSNNDTQSRPRTCSLWLRYNPKGT